MGRSIVEMDISERIYMLHFLKSKVAIVIGGSGAIGSNIVQSIASEGITTIFTYNSNDEKAKKIIDMLNDKGLSIEGYKLDASSEDEIMIFYSHIYAIHGRIDIIINCLGITANSKVLQMPYESWNSVISVNLDSIFLSCKYGAKYMLEKSFGRIINIGSVVGQTGCIGAANYAASKSALEGFSKSLALELAPYNITVNVIALGFINAGMGSTLPPKIAERIIKSIPLGRFGDVDSIAKSILFFATDEAEYITGQTIGINGGYYM